MADYCTKSGHAGEDPQSGEGSGGGGCALAVQQLYGVLPQAIHGTERFCARVAGDARRYTRALFLLALQIRP